MFTSMTLWVKKMLIEISNQLVEKYVVDGIIRDHKFLKTLSDFEIEYPSHGQTVIKVVLEPNPEVNYKTIKIRREDDHFSSTWAVENGYD